MTTPRGFRDRSDESLLTLVGQLPELVTNLVKAELDAAKKWALNAAKDGGIGAGAVVVALFLLFWSVAAFLIFAIWGISSWLPIWLSALIVGVGLVVVAGVLVLVGIGFFKKIGKDTPVDAAKQDALIVKEARDDH